MDEERHSVAAHSDEPTRHGMMRCAVSERGAAHEGHERRPVPGVDGDGQPDACAETVNDGDKREQRPIVHWILLRGEKVQFAARWRKPIDAQ